MKIIARSSIPLIAAALFAGTAQAETALLPGNAASGKTLHAANCTGCHDSSVYTRKNRQVNSVEGLIGRVNGCNKQLGKNFSRDQINDLVMHLNESYYKLK